MRESILEVQTSFTVIATHSLSFAFENFRRIERTLVNDPPLFLPSDGSARLRLLCLRSDRLLCILRIATPPSSVEKSKPR